jgi:hypothetical protein
VGRAPTARAAGDDTTDRAQLHPQIVCAVAGAVYSLAVLGVRGHHPFARISVSAIGHSASSPSAYRRGMPELVLSFTTAGIADEGFDGFLSVGHLRASRLAEVPKGAGVYVVMRPAAGSPTFLSTSAGGWFKGTDPTVPVSVLEARWISSTEVLYIGKATAGTGGRSGLRKRVGQLLAYGSGKPVGHQGGRYLWQVADSDEFLVAWRAVEDPTAEENRLLAAFFEINGAYPFANIAGPRA